MAEQKPIIRGVEMHDQVVVIHNGRTIARITEDRFTCDGYEPTYKPDQCAALAYALIRHLQMETACFRTAEINQFMLDLRQMAADYNSHVIANADPTTTQAMIEHPF